MAFIGLAPETLNGFWNLNTNLDEKLLEKEENDFEEQIR